MEQSRSVRRRSALRIIGLAHCATRRTGRYAPRERACASRSMLGTWLPRVGAAACTLAALSSSCKPPRQAQQAHFVHNHVMMEAEVSLLQDAVGEFLLRHRDRFPLPSEIDWTIAAEDYKGIARSSRLSAESVDVGPAGTLWLLRSEDGKRQYLYSSAYPRCIGDEENSNSDGAMRIVVAANMSYRNVSTIDPLRDPPEWVILLNDLQVKSFHSSDPPVPGCVWADGTLLFPKDVKPILERFYDNRRPECTSLQTGLAPPVMHGLNTAPSTPSAQPAH